VSRNYYSQIHLHLTWYTKGSSPLLVPKVEAEVHHYLRGRCINTPGVFVHAVGGTETHVHMAVSIAPTILISDVVGQLKGSSSHDVNQKLGGRVLEWQTGYGVVSFGTKGLAWVIDHVLNQKDRHARAAVEDRLERITAPEAAEADPQEAP